MKLLRTIFVVTVMFSCFSHMSFAADDLKKTWNEVLKGCAKGDLLGNNVLYFGPAQNLNVGTIFRKGEDKGYYPQWRPSDYLSDDQIDKIINGNGEFACSGNSDKKKSFSPLLAVQALMSRIGIDASAELKHSSNV
jgi:hypothetical protein